MSEGEAKLYERINDLTHSVEKGVYADILAEMVQQRLKRREKYPELNMDALEASLGMPSLEPFLKKNSSPGEVSGDAVSPADTSSGVVSTDLGASAEPSILSTEAPTEVVEGVPIGETTVEARDGHTDMSREIENLEKVLHEARKQYISKTALYKKDTSGWRRIKRANGKWFGKYVQDLADAKAKYYDALNTYVRKLSEQEKTKEGFDAENWKVKIFEKYILQEADLVDNTIETESQKELGKVALAFKTFAKNWSKQPLLKKAIYSSLLAVPVAAIGAVAPVIAVGRRFVGTLVGSGTGMVVGRELGKVRDRVLEKKRSNLEKDSSERLKNLNFDKLINELNLELDAAFAGKTRYKKWEKGTRVAQIAAVTGASFAVGYGIVAGYHQALMSLSAPEVGLPEAPSLAVSKPDLNQLNPPSNVGSMKATQIVHDSAGALDQSGVVGKVAEVKATANHSVASQLGRLNTQLEEVARQKFEGLEPNTVKSSVNQVSTAEISPVTDSPLKPKLEQIKHNKIAVVGEKQGAWHPVYKQFEARLQADPTKYGLTTEQLQDPAIVKAKLNQLTTVELRRAGFIGDGVEQRFAKAGTVLELDEQGHIKTNVQDLQKQGVLKQYSPDTHQQVVSGQESVASEVLQGDNQLDPIQKIDLEQHLDPHSEFPTANSLATGVGDLEVQTSGEVAIDDNKPGFNLESSNPDPYKQVPVAEGALPRLGNLVEQYAEIPLNRQESFVVGLLDINPEQYKLLRMLNLSELQRVASEDLQQSFEDWTGQKVVLNFRDGTTLEVYRADLGDLPEVAEYILQNPEKFNGATASFLENEILYGIIRDKQAWVNFAFNQINKP